MIRAFPSSNLPLVKARAVTTFVRAWRRRRSSADNFGCSGCTVGWGCSVVSLGLLGVTLATRVALRGRLADALSEEL